MTDISAISAAFDEALKGALLAGLVWLGNHFRKNRKSGRERDEVIATSAEKTDTALREFSSQLTALTKDGWAWSARSSVMETRLGAIERDLQHLREDLQEMRRGQR